MISEILTSILGYILIGGFVLGLLSGSIYAIICGIREYLEERRWILSFCNCYGKHWCYDGCNSHFKGFGTIIGGYVI